MHYLYFSSRIISYSFILLCFFSSCKGPKPKVIKSPPYYGFKDVYVNKLDNRLREISGLAWDRNIDKFYAHYDEAGTLFLLERETKDIMKEYKFAGRGDFEDVAIYDNEPYVLRSDGMIMKVVIDSAAGTAKGIEAGKLGIGGTNDFETMYTDTGRKALILICKNCASDDKTTVSAYAFYPGRNEFDTNPVFQIDAGDVESLTPKQQKTSKFQPSAASIHPIMRKLFILSSASSQLVVTDLNGNVEEVYELGKKLFPQPEGLTFKNNGDLYISNEGVKGKATILRFIFKPGAVKPAGSDSTTTDSMAP